jgi:hypothetical protein
MARMIDPVDLRRGLAPGEGKAGGGYAERVVKYIPAEVVAVYTAVRGLLPSPESEPSVVYVAWIVFALFLIATPVYLWRVNTSSREPGWQIAIASAAFVVWAYSLGGQPFVQGGLYRSYIGGILLVLFTFGAAFYRPTVSPPPSQVPVQ